MEVVKRYRFFKRTVCEIPVEENVPVKGLNRREIGVGGRLPGSLFSPTRIVTDTLTFVGYDNIGELLIVGQRGSSMNSFKYHGDELNSAPPYEKRIFPGLKMRVVVKP